MYLVCNNSTAGTCSWRLSTSSGAHPIYIYKKADNTPKISITLDGRSSDAANQQTLSAYDGKTVDKITLSRSFAADGGWYTICLPFALTADDITTTFKGALFNEFNGVTVNDDGYARLQFKKVTETTAGVPYLVLPKEFVDNPVFTSKAITATPQTISHTCTAGTGGEELAYAFIGVFDPTVISGDNVRFVGGDKSTELLIPDGPGTMNGLRAYFLFPDSSTGLITHAKIGVEEDQATGINAVNSLYPSGNTDRTDGRRSSASAAVYTLTGQKAGSKGSILAPGIYIKNGKKIVVRQ